MASPFTPAERNQILQIAGLPPGAKTINTTALTLYPFSNTDQWSPRYNIGLYTEIIAALDDLLDNHTDSATGDAVREVFPDWDTVKFSELEVTKAPSGSEGTLFSARCKREEIRRYVSNLLGFFIPAGGYLAETEATLGRSIKDFRQNSGDR